MSPIAYFRQIRCTPSEVSTLLCGKLHVSSRSLVCSQVQATCQYIHSIPTWKFSSGLIVENENIFALTLWRRRFNIISKGFLASSVGASSFERSPPAIRKRKNFPRVAQHLLFHGRLCRHPFSYLELQNQVYAGTYIPSQLQCVVDILVPKCCSEGVHYSPNM